MERWRRLLDVYKFWYNLYPKFKEGSSEDPVYV